MSGAPIRNLFLVGVDHRIQYTNLDCGPEWIAEIQRFTDYLIREFAQRSPDLVAEEFNEELVARNRATACTVRDAARLSHREHLYCEPSSAERTALDLTTPEQREEFWLRRLASSGATRILFVCGDTHLSSFAVRAQAEGFSSTELTRGWGADWTVKQ